MDIDPLKIINGLKNLRKIVPYQDVQLDHFVRLCPSDLDMNQVLGYLSENILDPVYTTGIHQCFPDLLLLVVTTTISLTYSQTNENFYLTHRNKCVCLGTLVNLSPDVAKFALKYFSIYPSPFELQMPDEEMNSPKCKQQKTYRRSVTDLEVIQSCYNFLKNDYSFYKNVWNWSTFVGVYLNRGTELETIYCTYILAMLTQMNKVQFKQLFSSLTFPSKDQILEITNNINCQKSIDYFSNESSSSAAKVHWDFSSDVVTNVEGVLLPIFNVRNRKYFDNASNEGRTGEILVRVETTKINLRSLALGVSSGKAICVSGPVGCGKTTLVEHLAKRTGHVAPKQVETKSPAKEPEINGFLRIQLGDQTDSKMLLGQYHCTEIPGEFVWHPGVLTQAVMNGYWLLLEDIDAATQDVTTVLANLLENNYLSVPGFYDRLRISPGFQLFVTLRNNKLSNHFQHTTFQLLEKYLYIINMLPLTRSELCQIICENYPKLSTVASRMADVYLIFSSSAHNDGDKDEDAEMMQVNEIDKLDKSQLTGLPSSSRLVSTRDLLKLCKRSYPTFSVTSSECAYFVFQNAVDLFCSHLPHGPVKGQLTTSIGGKLGIIKSRCEFLSDEYKPVVKTSSEEITIGRVQLAAHRQAIVGDKRPSEGDDELATQKKIKTNDDSYVNVMEQMYVKVPTFSFTRPASCILERISVAVKQTEPVLLVGETGVGKTSSVQYLAHKTNHKLIVVNMNNQSDVSDLIGGFKPVDMAHVMEPLRNEFERLFKRSFNEMKNEKFLLNIAVCFRRQDFELLIKLMLTIIERVYVRTGYDKNRSSITNAESLDVIHKWDALKVKLLKLRTQLKNSLNISFAFIPGSLVNCIKNGDWVLLDEINLASVETLECLSTILEPDGSVVLLERGDYVPIERHPDFRIFACMNPSTDVGKKDLPVGIRNRFTEFFVDELTAENDLVILVKDYLDSTGIKTTKVLEIVQLYRKLIALAKLDLNDGLGNRPVYSLRTLCRALIICAKNLCGSIDRNLYESFCLSFLTQLDQKSHRMVLQLIQEKLLKSNVKSILSQAIPKPMHPEHANFEGYWIQVGPNTVQECENYILTPSVRDNLKDLARIISIGKLPILLQGPTSAGKTSLIEYVAKRSGNICLRINNHEHTDLQEYIGTYTADVSGKLSFKEGVLVQAMRQGYWIILDELNLAPSDILEALNRVLDDNRELYIPETQTVVKANANFMLFATQNPPGLYGGRKTLSRAFKNRFIELHFDEIPRAELQTILEKRCQIPASYAAKMVKTMSELQVNRKSTAKGSFTLRDLFRWGNRYTFADKRLLPIELYDWGQHLVDEGYLILSAKIRTDHEVEIIQTTLFNNFRKQINVHDLFTLTDTTSRVTRDILQNLSDYQNDQNIVWTFNMRRMAVMAGKAIQFDEPVLLVGPTGCGKTTICQVLSAINAKCLRILNCHMHTEGADFLGGLRPYRGGDSGGEQDNQKSRQLFEWADGPLIYSMVEGSFFLADEISLAEDSVLERLNCILEPERTVLLAEKGGVETINIQNNDVSIKAAAGFQFFATMNPGGDFGKKELSPALRNRFTEIWCRATDCREDLIKIAVYYLKKGFKVLTTDSSHEVTIADLATIIIDTTYYLKTTVDKLNFSIRDILAWIEFVCVNSDLKTTIRTISVAEALVFGLETMFLDSLEMLPHDSYAQIERIRADVIKFIIAEIRSKLQRTITLPELLQKKGNKVEQLNDKFGLSPFYVAVNPSILPASSDFKFTAPTTLNNLFRLLSALSLNKSILLEGPPGVGKTSLIVNLTNAIGYKICRINLCEHTDLADLFGTDLPDDDAPIELNKSDANSSDTKAQLGSFVWRDGPLLAALKSENTWILLDEMNLAPQSVLEGLNAILDHRGEVYIPELNKTFKLGQTTRIFASQNPLRQGGGRKGLPQSFLNRFTKVYLRKLNTEDLRHVVNGKYGWYFEQLSAFFRLQSVGSVVGFFDQKTPFRKSRFDLCEKMVSFSETLDSGIANFEFGHKGGPFEVNLRDILKWCDLLAAKQTGFNANRGEYAIDLETSHNKFVQILYEKMKLVYCLRMRTEMDKSYVRKVFGNVFNCDADLLEQKSQDICVYWNDESVYLGDIQLCQPTTKKIEEFSQTYAGHNSSLFLDTQFEMLKGVAECVLMENPVILCGPTDSGKTKLIETFCTIAQHNCIVDTIDDSVTGSFQQVDFNRHLEDVSHQLEAFIVQYLQHCVLVDVSARNRQTSELCTMLEAWEGFRKLMLIKELPMNKGVKSTELVLFRLRLMGLEKVFSILESTVTSDRFARIGQKLVMLRKVVTNAETLNACGHFEWVDSKIVKALKQGTHICLEHVNLCSAAILDRLNPIFEPNGHLLVSEKGVNANNESEIVTKHKNFRAYLTLDPKNGEISRAMRNRCVELNVAEELYSEDNLKQLMYANGVRKMYLIDMLVRIHKSLKTVSEFNHFGVSHAIKCGFLVAENQRMGCDDRTAVYQSAVEVYVHSSNSDLLGFGLNFYRSKLKQVIADELQQLEPFEDVFNYENIILKSNNLNSLSLIRLQSEPFLAILNCILTDREDEIHAMLCHMKKDFENLTVAINVDFLKYLLYFLYEISSCDDIEQRSAYLRQTLETLLKTEKNDEKRALLHLLIGTNGQLYKKIVNLGFEDKCHKQLPWNSKLMPRIREYDEQKLSNNDQFRVSASLVIVAALDPMNCTDDVGSRIGPITAINYSLACKMGYFSNNFQNAAITHLYDFILEIRKKVFDILADCINLTVDNYLKLIVAILWTNRFLEISQDTLFMNKVVNENLFNNLAIHFSWLEKFYYKILVELTEDRNSLFSKPYRKIKRYLVEHHQLTLIRKYKNYGKKFTNSLPCYETAQIQLFEQINLYRNRSTLVAQLGTLEPLELNKRIHMMFTDENEALKKQLVAAMPSLPDWLAQLVKKDQSATLLLSGDMFSCLEIFFEKLQPLPEEINVNIENELTRFVQKYENYEKIDVRPLNIFLDFLPLLEYFAIKSFGPVLIGRSDAYQLNGAYFQQINSIGVNELHLVNTVTAENYRTCEDLWLKVMDEVQLLHKSNNCEDLQTLIDGLPNDYYKNYSSFHRNLMGQQQQFAMSLLCVRNASDENAPVAHNGPLLTNSALNILFDRNGELKSVGLGGLEIWRNQLKSFTQLLWNNVDMSNSDFCIEQSNVQISYKCAVKLLTEINLLHKQFIKMESKSDFCTAFQDLIQMLKMMTEKSFPLLKTHNQYFVKTSKNRTIQYGLASMMNALIGSIEINLISFMPYIDPVEKNRLKKMYNEADQTHLENLLGAYNVTRIIMNYKGLGEEMVDKLQTTLSDLQNRIEKFTRKVALRPNECLYKDLAKDINHFVQTCCNPKMFLSLFLKIDGLLSAGYLNQQLNILNGLIDETIKEMELWTNNAKRFKFHTLSKYAAYYRDFTQPMENAINMLIYGLTGLEHSLMLVRDSIVKNGKFEYLNINQKDEISTILENLIAFPNLNGLNVLPGAEVRLFDNTISRQSNINIVLNKLEQQCDWSYCMLMKSKLIELKNAIVIATHVTDERFDEFDTILNVFNIIWNKQEELRKKRRVEDESLYVNKTRCETEDEEATIADEIQRMFPNDVVDDFGEFIQADTLEHVAKPPKATADNAKKFTDILHSDDVNLICQTFILIMGNFSKSYYYNPKLFTETKAVRLDYVAEYKSKLQVFHILFNKYKSCLSSRMDDKFYNGIGLIVGIAQENYDILHLSEVKSDTYNFYKDSNISEILPATELLDKIEIRVKIELEKWPDHAVLNDIIRIIHRIRSLPSTSSIVRFSAGFQLLRQKVDEWNKVAHKLNHMKDCEIQIAEHIQRWTKLELQCWRQCLSQSFEKIQSKANRYWFFIYNLLHEYLKDGKDNLIDFKSIEKFADETYFVDEEEAQQQKEQLKSKDVINILRQFIESSNFAEFPLRMKMLRSFELYLNNIKTDNVKRKDALISILHNLCIYFEQFSDEIRERILSIYKPIEKKVKELVKIESYNKDLSYFSMKNNIARVHRNLHKILKELEQALNQKVSSVLVMKDSPQSLIIGSSNTTKPVIVEVTDFLASQRGNAKYHISSDVDLSKVELLARASKLFVTSRNIVKQGILHAHFPSLIYNLDLTLTDQLEACDYLRKLEVDRSQEKVKQKVQAKQILTQKRKALSDCYKLLATLGLSYRAGLMESSIRAELTDLKISPFCLKTMVVQPGCENVNKHFTELDQNLDLYYAKCLYKFKLLQTVLLTPSAELGLQHLERIKGFSADMFLLVQEQRKNVSFSVRQLDDLRVNIQNIDDLHKGISTSLVVDINYIKLKTKYTSLMGILRKIIEVFTQYKVLLRCAPEESESKFSVLSNGQPMCKSSKKYIQIKERSDAILKESNQLFSVVVQFESTAFHQYKVVSYFECEYVKIMHNITDLLKLLKLDDSYMSLGRPILELVQHVAATKKVPFPKTDNDPNEYANIDTELENLIHSMLISMQNIYKKYSNKPEILYGTPDVVETIVDDDVSTNDLIQEQHLSKRIQAELMADLKTLNTANILTKLSNILLIVKYTKSCKLKYFTLKKIVGILPLLDQYHLLCKFYLVQQIAAHKVSTKILSTMLTIFAELGSKGFCVPADLMQDEDGDSNEQEQEQKDGQGFGLEDGTGEKDVSDKIESEDQLDSAKKPGDDKETDDKEDANCKEEKGIDMSDDFDSKLQDLEKHDKDSDDDDNESDDDDVDKQMGETEEGAEKLDDQVWGSDEEKDEEDNEDNEMNDEEDGKGSKDEDDLHNNLEANKNDDKQQGEDEQGLDAADNADNEKRKKEKDIDQLNEPDVGEDQVNPYHNELEEPPEPEDIDLADNFNLDNQEQQNDNPETTDENPFDIDKMKENIEIDEDGKNDEDEEDPTDTDKKVDEDSDDSDDGGDEGELKKNPDQNVEETAEEEENRDEETTTETSAEPNTNTGEEEEQEEENKENSHEPEAPKDKTDDFHESKDKASKEENVQAMPDELNKGSSDQVQNEKSDEEQKQEQDMDAQDTGEDKQGIGQAENEQSKSGHQGIADTKETKTDNKQQNKKETMEKRKLGNTDEERTISETSEAKQKQLKTIEKLNEKSSNTEDVEEDDDQEPEDGEEFQHVKDAKKTDKSTLDNATEDQSKKVAHEEQEDDKDRPNDETAETNDELMETDAKENEENLENIEEMQSESNESKSKKPSKNERGSDEADIDQNVDVEGDTIETQNVLRPIETSAHSSIDVLQDAAMPIEPSTVETLDMHKMFEKERLANRLIQVSHEDFELWQNISTKMSSNARELCEQLRLILEPTKCTRLKGDYRTGRRINMKKIIPYIASQFRKDKIWLRRTKPAQRDYKITIAIDDSKSMHHNNSKQLTLEAISLVSQALTLLESGKLSIISFGEMPRIILNHSDQFDGAKLVNSLNFDQNQSRIAELLEFSRIANLEERTSGSDNTIFENLLLVLSDGRNIFSEGEQNVRNAVKLSRLQRIFIVYIIIDNPENKHSILDIRVPSFSGDRKTLTMQSYLDGFPFPYYVIVRDLGQLPLVLSDAMRQWFELVNSEQ